MCTHVHDWHTALPCATLKTFTIVTFAKSTKLVTMEDFLFMVYSRYMVQVKYLDYDDYVPPNCGSCFSNFCRLFCGVSLFSSIQLSTDGINNFSTSLASWMRFTSFNPSIRSL